MKFQKILGTRDILTDECLIWQKIESISRSIFNIYGYEEIRTPLIEELSLFIRSLGEETEIVQKQMFTIKRDKDDIALRPEATACILRAYIENDLDKVEPLSKLYYMGPMFRAERPQKGRLRQFHHIGAEAIGSEESAIDVEIISLAVRLIKEYGINDFVLRINNLGCAKDKIAYAKQLKECIKLKKSELCINCQNRIERNIFRVLDCKNASCRQALKNLNLKNENLCPECSKFSDEFKENLSSLNINYVWDDFLVRGLDYYTRTVFELSSNKLGSQDAIGAGGRYDNLAQELGAKSRIGAVGFAIGVERIILALDEKYNKLEQKNIQVFIAALNEEAKKQGSLILEALRKQNIPSDTDYNTKTLKAKMRRANDLKAKFTVIIGEDELKKNVVMLKNMKNGVQREISREELIKELITELPETGA